MNFRAQLEVLADSGRTGPIKFGYRCDFRLPTGDGGHAVDTGAVYFDHGEEGVLGASVEARLLPSKAKLWKHVKVGDKLELRESSNVVAVATILNVYIDQADIQLRAGVEVDRVVRRLPPVPFPYYEITTQEFPLLSGVDPYSYTYFNTLQMPRLAEEFERLATFVEPELRGPLLEAAGLARKGSTEPHYVIVFVGD